MIQPAHFSVDPRLATILGENYSSSERALRELIDNAWDAEAKTSGRVFRKAHKIPRLPRRHRDSPHPTGMAASAIEREAIIEGGRSGLSSKATPTLTITHKYG